MSLLKELIVANEKCNYILIKDFSYKSGRDIMHALAVLFSETCNINYVCSDLPCSRISRNFRIKDEKLKLIDVFSDPYCWQSDDNVQQTSKIDCKLLKTYADENNKDTMLFIDSMSYWLFENSPESLYRTIHDICETSTRIVALLHEDSHSESDVAIVQSSASMIIEVLPHVSNEHSRFCAVFLRPNGKIDSDNIQYELDEEGRIIALGDTSSEVNAVPVKRPDPTANLTFNLKLNDDEKANREKLQLPYVKTQAEDSSTANTFSIEDGYYEDDDPDDDLDI